MSETSTPWTDNVTASITAIIEGRGQAVTPESFNAAAGEFFTMVEADHPEIFVRMVAGMREERG